MAASFSGAPVASMVTESTATSTMLARKTSTISMISPRVPPTAATFTSCSSRSTASRSSSSTIFSTLMSLLSCLVTCSRAVLSTSTTIVMRDTSSTSVGPTASESMLNPRRLNSPATRARTPGRFSTRTDNVCVLTLDHVPFAHGGGRPGATGLAGAALDGAGLGAPLLVGLDDVVVGGAGRHHREDLLRGIHAEVDDHGRVTHAEGLVQGRLDVLGALAAEPRATVGIRQLDQVRHVAAQVDLGESLLIEELLPLAHHAEHAVVDDAEDHGHAFGLCGGELLQGHLEAAVPVDGDHGGVRPSDLGADGRGDAEAHGPEAPGVDPRARLLVADQL